MQELTVLVQTNERLEQQLNSQSQSPAASGTDTYNNQMKNFPLSLRILIRASDLCLTLWKFENFEEKSISF
jgi:hypothetical protein